MKIYIDIDETIFYKSPDLDYTKAKPNFEVILKVNELYNSGHEITLWTARGTRTGIDWRQVTEEQLTSAGVLYHALKMGKPDFDIFIDDKAINSDNFNWINNIDKYLK
jgi:hypothetical protein